MSRKFLRSGLVALALTLSALGPLAWAAPVEAAQAVRALESVDIVTAKGVRRFRVEIADTDALRERGLMFRKTLAPDHGMLFEFPLSDIQNFWMKNTLISLDIIYIGADGRIVSIARNAKPHDETPLPSAGPALGVLEIGGGLAAKLGIEPGDQVRHPFFHP